MEFNENQMLINSANKDVKDIRELEIRIAEIEETAAYELDKINKQKENAINPLIAKCKKLKENLLIFCSETEMKETKTKKKKILLDGTIELIKAKKEIVCIDKNILNWVSKNRPEFVEKVEIEKVLWREFKGTLEMFDNKIIDKETGEIIECEAIGIIEKPQELKIIY